MTSNGCAVLEHRRRFADLVTESVREAAVVLELEQMALAERFPAMGGAGAVASYPAAIRDFLNSDSYRQVLDSYIAGRLEVNLLSKVAVMLEQVAPLEFLRRP